MILATDMVAFYRHNQINQIPKNRLPFVYVRRTVIVTVIPIYFHIHFTSWSNAKGATSRQGIRA